MTPPLDVGVQQRPKRAAPSGACDCHCHIFGPADRFPYVDVRRYTPPDATFESYSAVLRHLGLERAVIVQPTPYDKDHACTLDALGRLDGRGRAVAIIDGGVGDDELAKLTAAGFRGTRVGLTHGYGPSLETLEEVARRLAAFDWHVQFAMNVTRLPELEASLRALPVDVVIDHIGRGDVETGLGEPGFQALLGMLRDGRTWVKLSGPYYTSKVGGPSYGDLTARVRALVEANPDRVLWGTNWPHTSTELRPSDADLLDVLEAWIPDEATRRKILVDNPAALYRFD